MEMILLEVTLFCNLEIYLAMKMNDWRKPRKENISENLSFQVALYKSYYDLIQIIC